MEEKFLEFMFRCCNRLGFYVLPSENGKLADFFQILSGWAIKVFKCLYRFSPHDRVQVVDSVIFSQLIVKFEARLENIFEQLKHFTFPIKREHR